MSGTIPPTITRMTDLEVIYLYNLGIPGTIPAQLGNTRSLRDIRLRDNFLIGTIPANIANLPNLTHLEFRGNIGVSGTIPSFLSNSGVFEVLDLVRELVFNVIASRVLLILAFYYQLLGLYRTKQVFLGELSISSPKFLLLQQKFGVRLDSCV